MPCGADGPTISCRPSSRAARAGACPPRRANPHAHVLCCQREVALYGRRNLSTAQLDTSGITGGERVAVRLSSLVRVASSPDLYVLRVELRELRHVSLSTCALSRRAADATVVVADALLKRRTVIRSVVTVRPPQRDDRSALDTVRYPQDLVDLGLADPMSRRQSCSEPQGSRCQHQVLAGRID